MFFQTVYTIVRQIPKGQVATYGQIARLAGNVRMSRQVGWALHQNPCQGDIPCHRVVNRFGGLCAGFAFGGLDAQTHLLEAEGIKVECGTVDLKIFQWQA